MTFSESEKKILFYFPIVSIVLAILIGVGIATTDVTAFMKNPAPINVGIDSR